ncbi:MAG: hypothetical protein HYX83_00800 [Chloroflexi bacterium]|nr:hypothetical protein [Chloroflexota bacterium]
MGNCCHGWLKRWNEEQAARARTRKHSGEEDLGWVSIQKYERPALPCARQIGFATTGVSL